MRIFSGFRPCLSPSPSVETRASRRWPAALWSMSLRTQDKQSRFPIPPLIELELIFAVRLGRGRFSRTTGYIDQVS